MSDRGNARRSVFVLDDDVRVGGVVCKVLAGIGIAGRQFTNPIQFLAELKRSTPEAVVLDLALGETDAVDVIRKLEILAFKGRVLLISGQHEGALSDIERIGRSHGLRMLPSLAKPFRADDLKARLDASPHAKDPEPGAPGSPTTKPAAQWRVDFNEALRNNWLEVWYQPKIELKSLRICGAEALVRARHPNRGLIEPIDLLPPPRDPLFRPLSIFVIRQAMADWALFADREFLLKMAVNIPTSILNEPGFVGVVRQMIPSDPAFPGLIIEITEDEIIHDPEWIREVATQLRLYNAWISIDDFGSAYASLSRLKDLPFRELKLDRSFVSSCASDALKRGLCQTVADLAHRFGASVCAEGVDSADDLRCLMELGFDTAQGFLFARPMPAQQLLTLLVAQKSEPHWAIGTDPTDKASLRSRA